MNLKNSTYLKRSLKLLEKWLPADAETMMDYYAHNEDRTDYETDDNALFYCLFSYPVVHDESSSLLERIVLLVYDKDQIIADCSALHGSMNHVLNNTEVIHYLCDESDWMDLEHYTLCNAFFPDPLPSVPGEALLYANAYVTIAYRQNGIFTRMLQMVRDHSLRSVHGDALLYSVLSLDPDIACYGPDASDEPYVYSMEQDEPKRIRNSQIMKELGWLPIRLEETSPSEDDDGTKLWFAIRKEKDRIIEASDELFTA